MTTTFNCLLAALFIAAGALMLPAFAADTTTQPAATQSAAPACCGDACKKMDKCCTADDKANVTCSMGGTCCLKPSEKKPDNKSNDTNKGMGGMDMGK